VILAAAGGFLSLLRRPVNRFAVFAGAWAFGMFLAYSIIPYKTPWLALNFVVPMAIAAGFAVETLGKRLAVPVVALAAIVCAYQSAALNFREYDNDRYPYVYSQTHRETHELVSEIERLAERAGTKELAITIASPENWPLPWYFRDNSKAGYPGTLYESYDPNTIQVVFTLRPGVRLVVFARRDLLS
jgi:predicted membrane-bound mannosyltransferase